MDVLCTDKTGTLTEGKCGWTRRSMWAAAKSEGVMWLAFLNAHFQTGLSNPLDDAVNSCAQELGLDAKDERKIGEIPYDFTRKRLSVITADPKGEFTLVTKGALDELLEVCSQYQKEGRAEALDQAQRAVIEKEFSDWSEKRLSRVGRGKQDGEPEGRLVFRSG